MGTAESRCQYERHELPLPERSHGRGMVRAGAADSAGEAGRAATQGGLWGVINGLLYFL